MNRLPPAARVLQQRRIPYQVHRFGRHIRSAEAAAAALGLEADAVYKTLVLQQDPPGGPPMILMAPAGRDVDMKAVTAALGRKRVRMASKAEAERVTGMQAGAISPIVLAGRGFTLLIAKQALERDEILVSAGEHGVDVSLAVKELLALTGARPVPV